MVSNARPKYSKRYMLIVGAGTCAVAVMALAAVAAHGRSSELMQGSDEVSLTKASSSAWCGCWTEIWVSSGDSQSRRPAVA